jgi:hypothetical protein
VDPARRRPLHRLRRPARPSTISPLETEYGELRHRGGVPGAGLPNRRRGHLPRLGAERRLLDEADLMPENAITFLAGRVQRAGDVKVATVPRRLVHLQQARHRPLPLPLVRGGRPSTATRPGAARCLLRPAGRPAAGPALPHQPGRREPQHLDAGLLRHLGRRPARLVRQADDPQRVGRLGLRRAGLSRPSSPPCTSSPARDRPAARARSCASAWTAAARRRR